jgi:hypothetical protein
MKVGNLAPLVLGTVFCFVECKEIRLQVFITASCVRYSINVLDYSTFPRSSDQINGLMLCAETDNTSDWRVAYLMT